MQDIPDPIDPVSGDGAYDQRMFYQSFASRKIERAIVPPRRNACVAARQLGQTTLIRSVTNTCAASTVSGDEAGNARPAVIAASWSRLPSFISKRCSVNNT